MESHTHVGQDDGDKSASITACLSTAWCFLAKALNSESLFTSEHVPNLSNAVLTASSILPDLPPDDEDLAQGTVLSLRVLLKRAGLECRSKSAPILGGADEDEEDEEEDEPAFVATDDDEQIEQLASLASFEASEKKLHHTVAAYKSSSEHRLLELPCMLPHAIY